MTAVSVTGNVHGRRYAGFWVAGRPAPQGSKTRGRNGGLFESSKAVAPWREAVRAEAQRTVESPFAGPVRVTLEFRLVRPQGHYGTGRNAGVLRRGAPSFPAGLPDIDKLARAVLDGLTMGGAWKDDSQAVALTASKMYGLLPGCMIGLEEMREDQ